jgi:CDP-diacylglycerol--glycerol-3-phosphate 3-phosphatidyltransferase
VRWGEVWTPTALAPSTREVIHEPVVTAPNTITVVRTVVSIVLAMAATAQTSAGLLVAAYLVYWVGDMADGEVARRLGLETRIGAVFDIVADRANSLTSASCFVALDPRLGVPLTIYVIEFAVVDTMLSLGFLGFEVKGPNDFHGVDLVLWRWNWSRPAKAVNTSCIVLACLAGQAGWATVFASAVLVGKVWSCVRLRALITAPVLQVGHECCR